MWVLVPFPVSLLRSMGRKTRGVLVFEGVTWSGWYKKGRPQNQWATRNALSRVSLYKFSVIRKACFSLWILVVFSFLLLGLCLGNNKSKHNFRYTKFINFKKLPRVNHSLRIVKLQTGKNVILEYFGLIYEFIRKTSFKV